MTITICRGMSFAQEMKDTKSLLEKSGHVCYTPEGVDKYINNEVKKSVVVRAQKEK